MNLQEQRNKTVAELEEALLTLRKDKFKTEMQRTSGQVSPIKPHVIKGMRRNIAQLETILNEKRGKNDSH